MSNVSSSIVTYSNLQLQLARYVYCPLYVAGNIGNILNVIVFSHSKLRSSSVCSWYFLILSIVNLIAINTGYLTRILSYMGLPDPSRTVGWYCKGRVYISTLSLTLGRHFLCSIIVDRFLVTSRSVKLRRISSFKVAKWYVSISVLCWMIFYVHIWIGYSGYENGSACKRQKGAYTLFIAVCSVIIDAILPIIVMITFSFLTLNNLNELRQRRNCIMPMTSNQPDRQEKNKIDRQLTLISLIQVLVYILFNTMNAGQALYSFITSEIDRSDHQAATESFVSAISTILTFIYGTLNFYIYTLASSTYRREFRTALRRCVVIIQQRFSFVLN